MSNTNCLSVTEHAALGRLSKLTKQTGFYLRFGDRGLLRVKLRDPMGNPKTTNSPLFELLCLGHPINGEVGTWLAPSGSQICSPFACPYSRLQ